MLPDQRADKPSGIVVRPFPIDNYQVSVETSTNGSLIPIRHRLQDPDHYKGPDSFQTVIDYGNIFVRFGLRDHVVPRRDLWSPNNLPPRGIKIYEFLDPEVASHIDAIEDIAERDFYSDPRLCQQYYNHNQAVFQRIVELEGIDVSKYEFVSLIRAGVAAGRFLGVSLENQRLIHAKRLYLLDGFAPDEVGKIAIGQSYLNPKDRTKLDGKDVLIGDPAGATYASATATIIDLVSQGLRPKSVLIVNTTASQKGALFAKSVLDYLDIPNLIISGGHSGRMNEHYYLETPQGTPSVRDAGDGLNSFLPSQFRL